MRLAGLAKPILLLGGVYFGIFAVVAFVMRRLDTSQAALSIVGGVMAYAYLLTILVIVVVRWRRTRPDRPREAAGGR